MIEEINMNKTRKEHSEFEYSQILNYISNILSNKKNKNSDNQKKKKKDNTIKYESSSNESQQLNIGFPIYGAPISYINENNEPDGIFIKIWTKILENLKNNSDYKNFDINLKIIENPNTEQLLKDMINNKYDIILGDYTPTPERIQYTFFSESVFTEKNVGVYINNDNEYNIDIYEKILDVLYYPLLFLIFGSILISSFNYIYKNNKSSYLNVYLQTINSFLGDKSGIITGKYYTINPNSIFTWLLALIIVIILFVFAFYIQTIAISKSLNILEENKDPFAFVKGKRVLIEKDSPYINTLINCCEIVPIESNNDKSYLIQNLADEFLKRHEKDDLIGFYASSPLVNYLINSENLSQQYYSKLKVSPTIFSEPSKVSFMITKYKPQLLHDINDSIHILENNGELTKICKSELNRFCHEPMAISMFFK